MVLSNRFIWRFLLLWPLIATIAAFTIRFEFILSIVVFFAPPTVVLALRLPRLLPRAVLFATLLSLGTIVAADLIAHASSAWFARSVFDTRLFGLAPWEDLLLGIVLTTGLVLFYEWHEQPRHHHHVRTIQWIRFGVFIGIVCAATTLIWMKDPALLVVSYPFVKIGIFAVVLPVVFDLSRHRSLTAKFLRATLYWAFVLFGYELAAMHQGWWLFPGNEYIGWLSIGSLAFPLDEFVFWICGIAAAGLTFYEFFIDDNR